MAKCKYCKAKLGTMLQPNLHRAGTSQLALGRSGVCRSCWEKRFEKKQARKAEGNFIDRLSNKVEAKTAELNEANAARAASDAAAAEERARFMDCPNGHVNYDAGSSCRTCGVSMAGAQPRAQAGAGASELVPCPNGHLNHPSRTECLVCGSAFGGAAAPAEEKMCPMCAEMVKSPAKVCRFCRHEFADLDAG